MSMNPELKRSIILAARAAVRQRQPESANPYPTGSDEYAVWQTFYRMTLTDEFRNDLIDTEYETSAY